MVTMTAVMVLMKSSICASVLPVNLLTVSGVTIVVAFILTSCAMAWMTVEMELMRKRSTVGNQPPSLVQKMNLSAAMEIAFHSTISVMMLMTAVTALMKRVVTSEKTERVLKICVNKIAPS